MAIILPGLVIVQLFWISQAGTIKEQQFDIIITKTLSDIADQLETSEAANRVSNAYLKLKQPKYKEKQINYSYKGTSPNGNVQISMQSTDIVWVAENDSMESTLINPENSGIASQTETYQISPEGKLNLVTTTTKEQENENEKLILVEKVVEEMFSKKAKIKDRINTVALQNQIAQSLREKGINDTFEFAVSDSKKNKQLSSTAFLPSEEQKLYQTKLFPSDALQNPNYLQVYFPYRKSSIWGSAGFMAGISLFLSGMVILIFSATIFVVLKQKKLSEVKTDFVNNMTHELKTPISTISLASQMLKDNSIPQEMKNLSTIAQIIDEETKRLSQQVEKVLQMAKLEKGKHTFRLTDLQVDKWMNEVLQNYAIQIDNKNGILHKYLNASEAKIMVDETHLTNVVLNLLDNALKYSKNIPDITVRTETINGKLQLSVEDKGIGITKEHKKKIFDPFYRVPSGNVHNTKGFGLGLNYVKKIIESHGGKVGVTSEPGKGTKFQITIPLKTEKL